MSSVLGKIAMVAMAWLAMSSARADIYVIVNSSNPTRFLNNKETVDLFMGRTRTYANGEYVLACDLPRDHPARSGFYLALTGMSQAQLNSYWSRLMFTGQVMPPQMVSSEQGVIDMVRRNPSAIGYVGQDPQEKGVRVVLTLKEGH